MISSGLLVSIELLVVIPSDVEDVDLHTRTAKRLERRFRTVAESMERKLQGEGTEVYIIPKVIYF